MKSPQLRWKGNPGRRAVDRELRRDQPYRVALHCDPRPHARRETSSARIAKATSSEASGSSRSSRVLLLIVLENHLGEIQRS